MTSMLPPTRDLPPGRQTRIRADLEHAVAGRRRSSRLTVPLLAAAAAVAVVATGVVLLRPASTDPAHAVHIPTAPPTTTTSADFGVPPETVAAIEEGCAKSAGVGRARLYQLLREDTTWALLYTDKEALTCSIGVGGHEYNSGFGQTSVQWLPGHFSVDSTGARAGGDRTIDAADAGMRGYRMVVGRVDSKVARVTYTADGETIDAKIANGTYAVRMYRPSDWAPSWDPRQDPPEFVRAYDAAGNLLGSSTDLAVDCYYEPSGRTIVFGDRRLDPSTCKPAQPWR
jgi:hypothetical protein